MITFFIYEIKPLADKIYNIFLALWAVGHGLRKKNEGGWMEVISVVVFSIMAMGSGCE